MTTAELEVPLLPVAKRSWRGTARILVPGLLNLGIQGIVVLALGLFTHVNNRPWDLHAWDGDWYLQIAQHGYLGVPMSMLDASGHRTPVTPMAFFPGYPLATKLASYATAGNFTVAGIAVSALAGIALAYAVARLTDHLTGNRVARHLAVILVSAAPMGIVWSMTYPEALFCALAAWALVGVRENRWWLAGSAVAAAGYVSPSAAPLIGIVMVAGFIAIYQKRATWSAALAVFAAPLPLIAYLAWVQSYVTVPFGYFAIQHAGWGTGFDFGVSEVKWIASTFGQDTNAFTVVAAVLAVAMVAFAILSVRRLPWPVWTYSAAALLLAIGKTGTPWDLGRLFLPAFPLALIPALALARHKPWVAYAYTALIAAAGIWYSAYSMSVWHYSI
jgi:hypothetical protein